MRGTSETMFMEKLTTLSVFIRAQERVKKNIAEQQSKNKSRI